MLARLADIDVPEPRHAFADRLSQWLAWTDAISLAGVLNGAAAAMPAGGVRADPVGEEGECSRLRGVLARAIAEDGPAPADNAGTKAGFSPFRRRYLAKQQTMEMAIGPLRERLRASLAARSPAMARLASMDAVMEQALGGHERSLLSTVPGLLERRFERLRLAHPPAASEPDGTAPPDGWLDLFRKDMQAVLLAELDIRLEPVEGLLEALRMRS